ncbi:MAG: hypothetical protein V3R94_06740, partial [Acidobacteriota bacterium]
MHFFRGTWNLKRETRPSVARLLLHHRDTDKKILFFFSHPISANTAERLFCSYCSIVRWFIKKAHAVLPYTSFLLQDMLLKNFLEKEAFMGTIHKTLALLCFILLASPAWGQSSSVIVIEGGTLIDGTGSPPRVRV